MTRKKLNELELKFLSTNPTEENEPTQPTKQLTTIEKIMQVTEREATIRFTVDLSQTLHHKLSLLALRSGKKKSEIVRLLLEEMLSNIDD